MITLFKIKGDSLFPLRKSGQRVVCIKLLKFIPINVGDIVIFEKKGYPKMIKRVEKINKNGYFVKGTIADSIDSRDFGYLRREELLYKQLF